ncbi:MAG: DUF2236 domain-containing protein [Actinobacteria bacterium]|nr:DUF2236 domain-containing protein [Actinomycetota bacterium]
MSITPLDDGLLGPDAVAWRVIGHPGALVGGLRSLIIQSLHPLAMAGVAEHSDFRRRPLERLKRTTYYVAATAFGDRATAEDAVRRVRRRHASVRGTDPVTGRPYSADDPDTQVWVHITEWHSFLAGYRTFCGPLDPADEDRYMREGRVIGSLLGTPAERIPGSLEEARAYFEAVRPELRGSDWARDAIRFVIDPPLTRELLPLQVPLRLMASAAVALVPRDLRRLAGIDRPWAIDVAALTAVRPLLVLGMVPVARELFGLAAGRPTQELIVSRAAGAGRRAA